MPEKSKAGAATRPHDTASAGAEIPRCTAPGCIDSRGRARAVYADEMCYRHFQDVCAARDGGER